MQEQISITMMSGPRDGDNLVFPSQDASEKSPLVLTIGRREGSDIRLNYDSQVSRLHAHLGFTGSSYWIEDMGSRNGTFINDERVEAGDRIVVRSSLLFRVGRTWLRIDPPANDITAAAEPIQIIEDDSD